ncbi:hypothetical protein [Larsenimonas salina]|uniref:hypothetical protein n=1 Tax=Larsenimonas salina TaxID=1295565 RepID=UPI002073D256|nr:hypothetical protein [Larsenimonas salina]MCM5703416.1 hypothetical protein [Larsenimonas salina]
MPDLFLKRGEAIKARLLEMESQASEEDLFELGYLIPQVELVLEMADYDPADVTADDFDATYEHWLSMAFDQDAMNDADRDRIHTLWEDARQTASALQESHQ